MRRSFPVWSCAPGLILAWLVAIFVLQRNALAQVTDAPDQARASKPSKSAASPDVPKLFTMHCGKCHGADGKGGTGRTLFPEIPDFTKADWQQRRTDPQLLASILEGKGMGMPAWQNKLNKKQARDLVRHVRAFSSAKKGQAGAARDDNDDPLGRLQQQFDKLRKELQSLSEIPSAAPPADPPCPTQALVESREKRGAAEARLAATDSPRALFLRYCAKCHGVKGSGAAGRKRYPQIPDFTDASRQPRRKEVHLVASILEGKGTGMPAWKDKLSREQAEGLASYIRSLSTSLSTSPKAEHELFKQELATSTATQEEAASKKKPTATILQAPRAAWQNWRPGSVDSTRRP